MWYVRSKDAPLTETAGNLFRSFWAFITGTETAWVLEAREAAAAGKADATEGEKGDEARGAKEHEEEGSATSSARGAKELSAEKRQVMVLGLLATATCWALFVWCVPCMRPAQHALTPSAHRHAYTGSSSHVRACSLHAPCAVSHALLRFADGMLIFRLLGADAEQSFARSWGVSYGINAAAEARQLSPV